VGLNQISAEGPRFLMMRAEATRDGLAAIDSWARSHNRLILVLLFTVVGAYLTARGAATLLG
jgi:hypothetical protein